MPARSQRESLKETPNSEARRWRWLPLPRGHLLAAWLLRGLPLLVDCNGLLLRDEPFQHARSTIEHLTADVRPRRSHAQHRPTVERARIPLQLRSEFYNLFNHANLYVNPSSLDIEGGGNVTACRACGAAISGSPFPTDRRNVQMAVKLIF